MADFHVYRDRLEIRLSRAEKVLALRRDDIVVPRDSIRSVAITADPWIWIRGVRAPGNSVPLTLAVGTWKFHGGKDFLVLKGKQRSAVVIDIDQPDPDDTADSDQAAQAAPDQSRSTGAAAATAPKGRKAKKKTSDAAATDPAAAADPAAATETDDPAPVAEGFSRVIVSTQHAAKLVEALRDIRPGADGPAAEVIG